MNTQMTISNPAHDLSHIAEHVTVKSAVVDAIMDDITHAAERGKSARRWNSTHGVRVGHNDVLNVLTAGADKGMTSVENGATSVAIRLALVKESRMWEGAVDDTGKPYGNFTNYIKGTFTTHSHKTMLNYCNVGEVFLLPAIRGELKEDYLSYSPNALANLIGEARKEDGVKRVDSAIAEVMKDRDTTRLTDGIAKAARDRAQGKTVKETSPKGATAVIAKRDTSEPVEVKETVDTPMADYYDALNKCVDIEHIGDMLITIREGENIRAFRSLLMKAAQSEEHARYLASYLLSKTYSEANGND